MAIPVKQRLPAPERRQAIIDAAIPLFAERSYRGVTTADVSRAAGVTEPVLYRHFAAKRELYLACIDETWRRALAEIERVLAEEPPETWPAYIGGRGAPEVIARRKALANFWVQALSEASEDPVIRDYLRRHLSEVNSTIANVFRQAQGAGAIVELRDAGAEAWISMAIVFLEAAGRRLGGIEAVDFERINASRRCWLTEGA